MPRRHHPNFNPEECQLLLRINQAGEVTASNAHRDPVIARLSAMGMIYGTRLYDRSYLLRLTPEGKKMLARKLL
jgi:DNA-binding MarR family transcriptional regulator